MDAPQNDDDWGDFTDANPAASVTKPNNGLSSISFNAPPSNTIQPRENDFGLLDFNAPAMNSNHTTFNAFSNPSPIKPILTQSFGFQSTGMNNSQLSPGLQMGNIQMTRNLSQPQNQMSNFPSSGFQMNNTSMQNTMQSGNASTGNGMQMGNYTQSNAFNSTQSKATVSTPVKVSDPFQDLASFGGFNTKPVVKEVKNEAPKDNFNLMDF